MSNSIPDFHSSFENGHGSCNKTEKNARVIYDETDTLRCSSCDGNDVKAERDSIAWKNLALAIEANYHIRLPVIFEALKMPPNPKGAVTTEVFEKIVNWAKKQHVSESSTS